MPSMLELKNVNFGYAEQPTLCDISFSLEPGESLAILGPNGSGKSTVLKLICGLLKAQQGQVEFQGENINSWSAQKIASNIAMLKQSVDIDVPYSVYDLLCLGRFAHSQSLFQNLSPQDKDIVHKYSTMLDCQKFHNRLFTKLSQGEKQRALLCQAMIQEPKLLLLDEPSSALDLKHSLELLGMIDDLRKEQNLSVIMVNHDLGMAFHFCQKSLLLKEGQMFQYGANQQVLSLENIQELFDIKPELLASIFKLETHLKHSN